MKELSDPVLDLSRKWPPMLFNLIHLFFRPSLAEMLRLAATNGASQKLDQMDLKQSGDGRR